MTRDPLITALLHPTSIAIVGDAAALDPRVSAWLGPDALRVRLVSGLSGPVGLAVLACRPEDAAWQVHECLARGAGAVCLLTDPRSGGSLDGDDEGADDELTGVLMACAEAGVPLLGPGSGGLLGTGRAGGVALVGALGPRIAELLDAADRMGVRLGAVVDVGLEGGVGVADLVRALARTGAAVIALAAPRLTDPAALVAVLRALDSDVPVVAWIPGAEPLADLGVDVVASSRALMARAGVLAAGPPSTDADGRKIAVVGADAAACAVAAGAAAAHALALPPPTDATRAAIASEVHHAATIGNPTDLLPLASPRHIRAAARAWADQAGVTAVVLAGVGADRVDGELDATWLAAPSLDDVAAVVEALAPPVVRAHAARGGAAVTLEEREAPWAPGSRSARHAQAVIVAAHLTRRDALTPPELERVLASYGLLAVRRIPVLSGIAARRAAHELGFPVDVEVLGRGGAVLGRAAGLGDAGAAEEAVSTLLADHQGADPMVAAYVGAAAAGGSVRLHVAVAAHPALGHVLSVDTAGPCVLTPLPLSRAAARRIARHLLADDDGDAGLAEALGRVALLATDFPEVVAATLTLVRGAATWSAIPGGLTFDLPT